MKKTVLVLLFILGLVIGIISGIKVKQKRYDYEISEINEYNYFIYMENESFGVINKKGDVIIEAKYENIVIPNIEKDVFICYNEEKSEVLNSNKEKLFSNYEEVDPIKLKNVTDAFSYEKSILKYKKDGLYGLMDFNGKAITKNIYDSIENLAPTEGKFLVSKDNKKGVIDLKGNKLVNIEFDNVISDEYYTKENEYKKSGFIVCNKEKDGFKFGYIDYKGKTYLTTKYNEIERIQDENNKTYLIISNNGKYGLYNKSKKIISPEFQSIVYDDNLNVLVVQKNKKFGVYSLDGKKIIEEDKDEVSSRGIYLYVKKANENKVYDKQGKEVDINYNRTIYETKNEEYRISTILNNNITYYGIINKNGTNLVEEKYRYIEYLYNNFFIATNDEGLLGVINSDGKVILDFKYNLLQKIKGMQIVQAGMQDNVKTEFYSNEMKKVLEIEKPSIEIKKDYVIISNETGKKYLNSQGNEIQDTQNLENKIFPEVIGGYQKKQTTLDFIYYTRS